MRTLLWLDDERNPFSAYWHDFIDSVISPDEYEDIVWVKGYDGFVEYIHDNDIPAIICFDHDLGENRTGYDAAKFLVYWCDTHRFDVPAYYIQSNNPVGSENIRSYIESYKRSLQ